MTVASLVLLGGCFWGTERVLSRMPGVERVCAGYAGGPAGVSPTYYDLDRSGHSEGVRVDYDPDAATLAELLEALVEKSAGDPSPPSHPRYRRAVLCADATMAEAARRILAALPGGGAFAVEVGWAWTEAEPYHQGYYRRTLGD